MPVPTTLGQAVFPHMITDIWSQVNLWCGGGAILGIVGVKQQSYVLSQMPVARFHPVTKPQMSLGAARCPLGAESAQLTTLLLGNWYESPVAVATNAPNFRGVKQHKWNLSRFRRSGVWPGCPWADLQVVAGLAPNPIPGLFQLPEAAASLGPGEVGAFLRLRSQQRGLPLMSPALLLPCPF